LSDLRLSPPSLEELLPGVIRQLGYPANRAVGRDILEEVKRQLRRATERMEPRFLYRVSPITGWGRGFVAGQDLEIRSARWARLTARLEQPEVLCGFVVTLGQRLDEEIAASQLKSMFQAYLLDAAASRLVEEMADQVDRFLRRVLESRGCQATARFSPGYCDWEIGGGQTALFRFLDPHAVGVRLSSGGMMIPRKSISACVIGAREVAVGVPCVFCAEAGCSYRRGSLQTAPRAAGRGMKRKRAPRDP